MHISTSVLGTTNTQQQDLKIAIQLWVPFLVILKLYAMVVKGECVNIRSGMSN